MSLFLFLKSMINFKHFLFIFIYFNFEVTPGAAPPPGRGRHHLQDPNSIKKLPESQPRTAVTC